MQNNKNVGLQNRHQKAPSDAGMRIESQFISKQNSLSNLPPINLNKSMNARTDIRAAVPERQLQVAETLESNPDMHEIEKINSRMTHSIGANEARTKEIIGLEEKVRMRLFNQQMPQPYGNGNDHRTELGHQNLPLT